jgi:hypothetical protein
MKQYFIVEGTVRNNIGDILQGMAAAQFLRDDAVAVDREKLARISADEPGFLLATGWFMHDYSLFPSPSNILPFYISVHVANSDFLRQPHIREHFRAYGPVGCRDKKTLQLFLGWGIPAYYSGCLTITTKPKTAIRNDNEGAFLMVDNVDHPVPAHVLQKIESLLQKKLSRISHDPEDVALSFHDYVSAGTRRMQHLLNTYCDASLVVTTKIHCALPCLGMGANVILIHPNPKDPRLQTVRKFMEIISYEQLLTAHKIFLPKVKMNALEKQKQFITEIVEMAVQNNHNPIRYPVKFKHRFIKIRSILLASIFRFAVVILLKTGFATPQMKRVFSK